MKETRDPTELFDEQHTAPQSYLPRMTVLYHSDLSRVGAITAKTLFEGGAWVDGGRTAPIFMSPAEGSYITSGPLGDREISPLQFQVRWHEGFFEIRPAGRLPLCVLEFNMDQGPVLHPIDETTRLKPGALIAIGDRLVLYLHLASWNPPGANRLGMVGETEVLWELRRNIFRLAQFDKAVHIFGATGTGKELTAQALHTLSRRSEGPFVPINCAALPERLAESVLFGHKKGAFTDAHQARSGAFEDARSGVLFMDEVGELALELQAKLLRVLQEGVVVPVGSHTPVTTHTRVITATNRNLEEEVERGRVRADFYYRIAGLSLKIPSLEERRWDVPVLFVHFLMQALKTPGIAWMRRKPGPSLTGIPMTFFLHLLFRAWPGNIRELQNLADQVCYHNLSAVTFVSPELFRANLQKALTTRAKSIPSTNSVVEPPTGMNKATQAQAANLIGLSRRTLMRLIPDGFRARAPNESLEELGARVEEMVIHELLEVFDAFAFNQVQIAERLGLSRATLIRLMKRYGIPRHRDLDNLTEVVAQYNGDQKAVAEHLGLSTRGLELYLKHFG